MCYSIAVDAEPDYFEGNPFDDQPARHDDHEPIRCDDSHPDDGYDHACGWCVARVVFPNMRYTGRERRATAHGFLIPLGSAPVSGWCRIGRFGYPGRQNIAEEDRMSKKSQSGGKSPKSGAKSGGFKQPVTRSAPLSRRPPRQPGR